MAEIGADVVKALRERTGAGMMDCKRALAEAGGDVQRAIDVLRERGLAKAVKRAGRTTSEGTIAIALAGRTAGMVELGCETDFVAKTPEFQALAESLAAAVASDPGIDGPEALLDATLDGEKASDRIAAAVAKLGENVVAKRVASIAVDGGGLVGGYVHAGGKLGVLVGLATEAGSGAVAVLAKDLAMHVAAADPSPVAVDRDGVPPALVERERELFARQARQEGKPDQVVEKIVEGRVRKYYSEVCLLEQGFVKDPEQKIGDLVARVAKQAGAAVRVTGFARFKLGEAGES